MSAVTPVLTGMVSSLITEVLVVVAAVAALVGIGILVAYGFRKLREDSQADARDIVDRWL